MTAKDPLIYAVYIGNPGASLSIRTAVGLREANRIARDGSVTGGHARVTLDGVTVAEWHLGLKREVGR